MQGFLSAVSDNSLMNVGADSLLEAESSLSHLRHMLM